MDCGGAGLAIASRHNGKWPRAQEPERFKSFTYQELIKRDKINLDTFWLKDAVTRVKERPGFPSLEDSANLLGLEIQVARFP